MIYLHYLPQQRTPLNFVQSPVLLGGCSLLCEGPTITCTFVHKREYKEKEKKRNDEGSMLLQKRKERKTEEKKRSRGERVRRREREKNRVFLIATSIRDWGFVCGPILMKF
jgi:hypothetical protein